MPLIRFHAIVLQAPSHKRKKPAKGVGAAGGTELAAPAQQQKRPQQGKRQKSAADAAQVDELAASAAQAVGAAAQQEQSPAAAAGRGGPVPAKPGKANRKRKVADGAAAKAAVQSSLEAAGLELVPVDDLRASEAAGANGANGATARGEAPFRNREKVLMLTSRGIPPR